MVVTFLVNLIQTFGYLGIFISSILGSASIFIPIPSFIFVATTAPVLNPVALALIFGLGSAIGEITGYALGFAGKKIIEKEKRKWKRHFVCAEQWFKHHSGFLVIIIFAVTPLPFDVIGIFCGAVRYDWKRFFIATFIGKTILGFLLALAGIYGFALIDTVL